MSTICSPTVGISTAYPHQLELACWEHGHLADFGITAKTIDIVLLVDQHHDDIRRKNSGYNENQPKGIVMKNETNEVSETPESAPSFIDVAARAAVTAVISVVVSAVATALLKKAVKRFRKPKLTVVTNEK